MGKEKFKKGPHGVKFSASIFPWKIKKGGVSFIQVTFKNSNKDKNLTPAVLIDKIEKQAFFSKTFSPMSNDPKWFWIPKYATTIAPLGPGETGAVLIPIYTNSTTEKGDYKIYINVQAGEKGLGDYAKLMGKIAVSLFIGWRSVKYYLPLKVLDEIGEVDKYNEFMSLFGINIGNYGSFIPNFGSLTFRREILLFDKYDANNIIDIVTHKRIEGVEEKIEKFYRDLLPDTYDEKIDVEVDGVGFELFKSIETSDKGEKAVLGMFGYVEKINRYLYVRASTDPSKASEVIDLVSSMTFVSE